MYQEIARELLQFIEKSPTCFHATAEMAAMLEGAGGQRLREEDRWNLQPGGCYYVTRNDSSLIAFSLPRGEWKGYHIMASHSDSPSFKVKENPELVVENRYVKLNVEQYGGMLCAPWFDRPLSVAGRVIFRQGDVLTSRLVNVDRDLVMIPNLAIHMNRDANKGYSYNAQRDMLPLLGDETARGQFMNLIAEAAGVEENQILGHDLFLYNRQKGTIWGAGETYVSCGRLDDLQCAFSSLKGFLLGKKQRYAAVHCVLDNEEVGSATRQGAGSTFLYDVLVRINSALGGSYEDYLCKVANSFMVSADNAHALHPNHPDKADPVNRPAMNAGIVIKYSANQKYCTDGVSAAMFKELCRQAQVPYQVFTNRSDMPGGSTLGNIAAGKVAVRAVDIGLPQLAMHSPYETAGVKDTEYLIRAAEQLFA